MPRVSICLPTFNRANSLKRVIRTVLNQTYEDWELIIGDDASTDSTQQVVRGFDAIDKIAYVRRSSNLGLYQNWNDLLGRCSGEYVAIYHDHDLYFPTILAKCVEVLERSPRVQFVHTSFFVGDAELHPIWVDVRRLPPIMAGQEFRRALAGQWPSPVMAATVLARRSAYASVGCFPYERFGLACDKDVWFRMSALGDVGYIREPQAIIRGRLPGEATARFDWTNEVRAIQMRSEHVFQVAEDEPRLRRQLQRQFVNDCDTRLAVLSVRSIILDSDAEARHGLAIAAPFTGMRTHIAVALTTRSATAKWVLTHIVLSLHRARVRLRAAVRRALARAQVNGAVWRAARLRAADND